MLLKKNVETLPVGLSRGCCLDNDVSQSAVNALSELHFEIYEESVSPCRLIIITFCAEVAKLKCRQLKKPLGLLESPAGLGRRVESGGTKSSALM